MVLIDLLEEHLEEADFLFQQRENALSDRVYDLAGLFELEERLLAHLDGLLLGGKEAWTLLEPKLAAGEVGEVFAAAFIALESKDAARIDLVRKALSVAEGPVMSGLRHALRHAPDLDAEKVVVPLLAGEKGAARSAAIDVLSFRRICPERGRLRHWLKGEDPATAAAAANAAGRLRLSDLKREVEALLENQAAQVRLEAMRTAVLLKSERGLHRCRKAVLEGGDDAGGAMLLLGLAGRAEDVSLLVNALGQGTSVRNGIESLGLLGYIAAIETLIGCAADPALARLAGEAISLVTGADLEEEGLLAVGGERAEPEKPEGEEEAFEVDPDEALPFPDPARLREWWKKNASRFDRNSRYRKGRPYGPGGLVDRLRNGTLPERRHTALELALADSSRPLLETDALTIRQWKEMALQGIAS